MTPETTSIRTAGLEELVNQLRRTIRQELSPKQSATMVSTDLIPFLARSDLLTTAQQIGDASSYKQHVLHVEEDGSFSIVSLVWLPGQRTPIHDHVSWCVVGVYVGEETEVRYQTVAEDERRFLLPIGTAVNECESVCGFAPPGDIHEVVNSSGDKTISIHIYGADISRLGSSIRRRYSFPIRQPSADDKEDGY